MRKNFLKALEDIKKQKIKQNISKNDIIDRQKNKQEDDISSDEQKKLRILGVFKKKIVKEDKQPRWKHDKYRQHQILLKQRIDINHNKYSIKLMNSPGYKKIMQLLKIIKIYIREIDDVHIVFNTQDAYNKALEIFKNANIEIIV